MDILRKEDRAELFNIMKINYKTNLVWYLLIWIVLLIPIISCAICTYNIINWDENIEDYVEHLAVGIPRDYPTPYLIMNQVKVLIMLDCMWGVILSSVFILSKRKKEGVKAPGFYISANMIMYLGVLLLVTEWLGNVSIIIAPGSAFASEPVYLGNNAILFRCLFSLMMLLCYAGASFYLYRFIKWLWHKLHYIVTIIIGLFIFVLFSFCSMWFFIIFLYSLCL